MVKLYSTYHSEFVLINRLMHTHILNINIVQVNANVYKSHLVLINVLREQNIVSSAESSRMEISVWITAPVV